MFWMRNKSFIHIFCHIKKKKNYNTRLYRSDALFSSTVNPWESCGSLCIIIAACQENSKSGKQDSSATVFLFFLWEGDFNKKKGFTFTYGSPASPPSPLSSPEPPPFPPPSLPRDYTLATMHLQGRSFWKVGGPYWLWQMRLIVGWIMIVGKPR